jgi:hypothetical protein
MNLEQTVLLAYGEPLSNEQLSQLDLEQLQADIMEIYFPRRD